MKGCGTPSCMGQYFNNSETAFWLIPALPASQARYLVIISYPFLPVCLRQSTVGFAFITLSLFDIRYSVDDIDELHAIYVCLCCCCRSLCKEGRSFHSSPQHSHLSIFSNPSTIFFTGARWPSTTMNLLQFLQSVSHSLWNVLETWEASRLEHGRRLTSRRGGGRSICLSSSKHPRGHRAGTSLFTAYNGGFSHEIAVRLYPHRMKNMVM
jgi:hypothetical protein